jgi:hypothetical protein
VVLSLVCFAIAAALWVMTTFFRMSTLGVTVVEWESTLHAPAWVPFVLVGVSGLFRAWRRGELTLRPAPPAPPARRNGPPVVAPVRGEGWLDRVRAGARAVTDDAIGKVRLDDAAGVPVALVLTNATREQARRRVGAYAAWLATIPTPPTASVRLISCPEVSGALLGLYRGELARHFEAGAVHVVSTHEGADAVFRRPDPVWRA